MNIVEEVHEEPMVDTTSDVRLVDYDYTDDEEVSDIDEALESEPISAPTPEEARDDVTIDDSDVDEMDPPIYAPKGTITKVIDLPAVTATHGPLTMSPPLSLDLDLARAMLNTAFQCLKEGPLHDIEGLGLDETFVSHFNNFLDSLEKWRVEAMDAKIGLQKSHGPKLSLVEDTITRYHEVQASNLPEKDLLQLGSLISGLVQMLVSSNCKP
ncbi:hypothetical protein AMTR_s00064p00118640 [Amborella trichopoda]|uniref:Uncharacterized protein n=1 Tax=Amborella trichopoda TaxID=13333 RepID=U5DB87_AMBTC|nr:hypothetical protein AMTR_s00064p00118640 [Amborella trichopoda]